jgi:hypothetical protein
MVLPFNSSPEANEREGSLTYLPACNTDGLHAELMMVLREMYKVMRIVG